MKTANDGDASSNGRPGIAALIEICHVVSQLLEGDTLQPEVLPLEPGEITVEIVGVGLDGACDAPSSVASASSHSCASRLLARMGTSGSGGSWHSTGYELLVKSLILGN
jgi:hypothetical protein